MENKICTTIEQSKKLIELGLDVNTADMHWQYIEEDDGQLQWFCFPKDFSINKEKSLVAWSLSALFGLLPQNVQFDKNKDCYVCSLFDEDNHFLQDAIADNPLNAVYSMVVYLLENGYIKTEKL